MGLRADLRQREELEGGELGDEQGGKSDHPEPAEEDKGEDGEDQDEGSEDAFHGPFREYRSVVAGAGGRGGRDFEIETTSLRNIS